MYIFLCFLFFSLDSTVPTHHPNLTWHVHRRLGFFERESAHLEWGVFTWNHVFKNKKDLLKSTLWRHHFFAGPLCKVDVCGNATLVDQVDEKLSQKEATKMKEPPCHLGGLYKAGKMLQIGPPLWILGNIHHPTNEKDVHVWFIWVVFRGFWVRYPKTTKYDRSCNGSFPKQRFQGSCQIFVEMQGQVPKTGNQNKSKNSTTKETKNVTSKTKKKYAPEN